MALSRLAQQFADEIRQHDWSDAPYRADRAGHRRADDAGSGRVIAQLQSVETERVRMNAMWVTAQVLGYNDPNFDIFEFAEACGVDTRTSAGRPRSGGIIAGVRTRDGVFTAPGRGLPDELLRVRVPGLAQLDRSAHSLVPLAEVRGVAELRPGTPIVAYDPATMHRVEAYVYGGKAPVGMLLLDINWSTLHEVREFPFPL